MQVQSQKKTRISPFWALSVTVLITSTPCFAGKKDLVVLCANNLVAAGPAAVHVVSLPQSQTERTTGQDLMYSYGYRVGPEDYQQSEKPQPGSRTEVDIHYSDRGPHFSLNMNRTARFLPSSTGYGIVTENVDEKNSRLIKPRKGGKRINTNTGGVEIEGKVLAGSQTLDVLLMDETLGTDLRRMPHEQFGGIPPLGYFPKFRLGTRTASKVTSVPLDGWDEILNRLEKGFGGALFLNRQGVDAQFSPDGRYLAINLKLTAHRSQQVIARSHPEVPASMHQDIKHNWIGLWDTKTNQLIYELTSRELDTPADKERTVQSPFPVEMSKNPMGWQMQMDRIFSMRFTDSGELILARAEMQNFNLEKADIYLKVVKILGTRTSPVFEANMGEFQALFRGDLTRGISDMLIANDGTSVAIRTTDLPSQTDWRITHIPD